MEELLRAIKNVDEELKNRIKDLEESQSIQAMANYKERYRGLGRIQGLEEARTYIEKYILAQYEE